MSQFLDVPTTAAPSKLASMMASSSISEGPVVGGKKTLISIVGDDTESEDEMPPDFAPSETLIVNVEPTKPAEPEGPTMMEVMMAEAAAAKKVEDEKKAKLEKKQAKKFGGGMKGGFFNTKPKKKTGGKAAAKKVEPRPAEEEVFELSPDGEMIPTLTKNNTKPSSSPLVLDDVQAAMMGEGASGLLREEKKWNNDGLMERIKNSPRMQAGLSNPRYLQAIEDMKKDPAAAQAKYKGQKDIEDFITEFAGIMGEHFSEVGAKEEQEKKEAENTAGNLSGPSIGPLAEDAIKREAARREKGPEVGWDEKNGASQEKVDAVVGNAELSSILMDPEMQKVLQDCGRPGAMHAYMRDKKWGPKIEMLIKHGLIKVER